MNRRDAQKEFEAIWDRVIAARDQAMSDSAELAERIFGPLPPPNTEEMFAPPKQAVKVGCMHCGDNYDSSEMVWEYRLECQAPMFELWCEEPDEGPITPLWWCKNKDCDGAGFGHDIHPTGRQRATKRAKQAAKL